MSKDSDLAGFHPGGGAFATTRWSLVQAAGDADVDKNRPALEELCREYWPPLYAHILRLGYAEATAQDLTQAFFARLLERKDLAKADPQRGRFRNFLLKSLTNFVRDEWAKSSAEKRGGKVAFVSFDDPELAPALVVETETELSPADYYDRRWAMTVLEQAWRCLRQEYARLGKAELLDALRPYFSGDDAEETWPQLAERLGKTTETVKSQVKYLRRRYHEALRQVVADTVSGPEEIEEELRYLLSKVAG